MIEGTILGKRVETTIVIDHWASSGDLDYDKLVPSID